MDAASMGCLFLRGSLRTVLSFLAKSQSFTNFLLVPLYFLRDLKWKILLICFDYDTYLYIIKSLPTLESSWDSSSSFHPCGLRVIINGTSFCSHSFFQFGQYTVLSPLLVSLHAVIVARLSSTLCFPVFIPAGEGSLVALYSCGSQGALITNGHIWLSNSNLGFAATIFSYQDRQANLSWWDEWAINNSPP